MKAPSRGFASSRGFTLIEAVVAITLTLLVASVAAASLVVVFHSQRQGQLRNAVARQTALIVDVVARDLEHAGVGVPRGVLAGETETWRPVIRTATPTAITIVGDAPYPTASHNGVVQVAGADAAGSALLLASADTGCVPGAGCSAGRGIAGSDCAAGDLRCVWSPDRWRAPPGGGLVDVVISFPDGRWVPRHVRLTATGDPQDVLGVGTLTGVVIEGGNIPTALLTVAPGPTIAATLDRIHYTLEDGAGNACPDSGPVDLAPDSPRCVLARRQCWGYADPENSIAAGAAPMRSFNAPLACDVPAQGTRWEVVTGAINQMRFRYFASDGTELVPVDADTSLNPAQLASIASVEVEASVIRSLPDGVVQMKQTMSRRVAIVSGGGARSTAVVQGGCAVERSFECLRESYQGPR